MNKKDLAMLIDAYADAKRTDNKYVISVIGSQLEQALDQIFSDSDYQVDGQE